MKLKKFFSLIVFSLLFFLFSCEYSDKSDKKNKEIVIAFETLKESRTVFLGDSNTFFQTNLPGWNLAVGGYTVEHILGQIPMVKDTHPFFIYCMIGTNNILGGTSTENFETDYRKLLQELKMCTGNVVMISIPPIMLPHDYNTKINEWNKIIQKLCEEENVTFLNNHDLFYNESLFLSDMIHFNAIGRTLWKNSLGF